MNLSFKTDKCAGRSLEAVTGQCFKPLKHAKISFLYCTKKLHENHPINYKICYFDLVLTITRPLD